MLVIYLASEDKRNDLVTDVIKSLGRKACRVDGLSPTCLVLESKLWLICFQLSDVKIAENKRVFFNDGQHIHFG